MNFPEWIGFDNFVEELISKDAISDRVVILICGSAIDTIITQLLKDFLIESQKLDDLLNPTKQRALSTFAARVDVANVLGLITSSEVKGLKDMAKIRNSYAHNLQSNICKIEIFKDIEKARKNFPTTADWQPEKDFDLRTIYSTITMMICKSFSDRRPKIRENKIKQIEF